MRNVYRYCLAVITVAGLAFIAAPGAWAASKDRPSSNGPWVIGVAVIAVLVLGTLLLRLRSGMRKRDPERNLRRT